MCASKMVCKFNCIMLVEINHLTKFKYYISLVHVRVFIFVKCYGSFLSVCDVHGWVGRTGRLVTLAFSTPYRCSYTVVFLQV